MKPSEVFGTALAILLILAFVGLVVLIRAVDTALASEGLVGVGTFVANLLS